MRAMKNDPTCRWQRLTALTVSMQKVDATKHVSPEQHTLKNDAVYPSAKLVHRPRCLWEYCKHRCIIWVLKAQGLWHHGIAKSIDKPELENSMLILTPLLSLGTL